jgi:rare lipoprotein A
LQGIFIAALNVKQKGAAVCCAGELDTRGADMTARSEADPNENWSSSAPTNGRARTRRDAAPGVTWRGSYTHRLTVHAARVFCLCAFALGGCSSEPPVGENAPTGATSAPAKERQARTPLKSETGLASFYSRRFDGKETAGGETFRNHELVAAHPSLPLGTLVKVTNLEADRAVEVEITDRGPAAENRREGVIIDVSQAAAARLGMKKDGRVKVRVDVLKLGEDDHKPLPPVKKQKPVK